MYECKAFTVNLFSNRPRMNIMVMDMMKDMVDMADGMNLASPTISTENYKVVYILFALAAIHHAH